MNVLLVGTANPHKVEEIQAVLADPTAGLHCPVSVIGAGALPPGPEVEETGASFEENAAIKAREYAVRASQLPAGKRPRWVIADDSGLCVDTLGGLPGVHSARYAGSDADALRNNQKLLSALGGVAPGERGAEFVCVIACVELAGAEPPPVVFFARGRCRGEILTEARGDGGFGYDPLFYYPPLGRSFAELPRAEKNRVSHRGEALRALRRSLLEITEEERPG